MTLTHNIYGDLEQSLKNGTHQTLSKLYTTPKGISLIYAMDRDTDRRSFYFIAEEKLVETMPQCKGLSINKVHLYEYSQCDYFCQILQKSGDEGYIYEIIIEDIRKNVEDLINEQKIAVRVAKLLLKWKNFFAQEKNVVLSPERQQGLYGELLFLKQMIDILGIFAITYWTGCDNETHDFYIKGNAVEIKTTSTKAPYKMHISSEYQLDDSEVTGNLLVEFFVFRKSNSDGDRLPELISHIRTMLVENPAMGKKFNDKLEDYGYFDGLEEKYTTGYHIREKHTYCVREGFPRVIKKELDEGVSGCTYYVQANRCTPFEILENEKIIKLKGSEKIG